MNFTSMAYEYFHVLQPASSQQDSHGLYVVPVYPRSQALKKKFSHGGGSAGPFPLVDNRSFTSSCSNPPPANKHATRRAFWRGCQSASVQMTLSYPIYRHSRVLGS